MIKLEELISVEKLISEAKYSKSIELNLSYCALESIPAEVFELENLQILKLIGNKISTIPPEIERLKSLTHLYLYNNRIKHLDDDIIDHIKYLECFELAGNPIDNDRDVVIEILRKVEKWKGYKECLKKIEDVKNNNKNSFYFDRPLHVFPVEIFELTEIIYLSFNCQNITEIPEGISNLQNLKYLDLSNNRLNKLPKDFVKLENLESLSLITNQFDKIPDQIIQLKNLKDFNISDNKLTEVNKDIFKMPSLKSFFAFANPFYKINDQIFNLPYEELKSYFL